MNGADLPGPKPSPRAPAGPWPYAAGRAGELAKALGPEREAEILGSAGRVPPYAPGSAAERLAQKDRGASAGGQAALPGLEAVAEPPPAPPAPPKPDPCAEVWAAYLGGRARAAVRGGVPVLDAKRKKLVADRLAEGFGLADVCAAARGIWSDPWHFEKGFTGLEYAIRNASAVERFRELGEVAPPPAAEVQRQHPRMPPGPPLSPERQREILEQYLPGVYTQKAAANG